MSVARPWWLLALALLLPLILLHLRRPALAVRDVADLAIWERLAGPAESADWRLRRPRHPVLLALQALALGALVLALAGPERRDGPAPATTVYVVDGSLWMHVGTRLEDARAGIRRLVGSEPRNHVAVVTATGTPAVAYRGPRSGLEEGLRRVHASAGAGDLAAGITLGAGLLGGRGGRMVVLRAPETAKPEIRAAPGQVRVRVVGSRTTDQGVFARGSRCGIGPSGACEILATVRNESASPRVDGYVAHVDGKPVLRLRVAVPAHGAKTLALTAQPGVAVRLRLTGRDALALDDTAWFDVPSAAGTPAAMTVTLVGDPATAKPLAQALAAAPGVTLNLRTPATYRRSDALASDLVVLGGWLPADGLPPAPAVALVAPPRLPGGSVAGTLAAPTVSTMADGDELVAGVDLRSLSIDRGAARRLVLPRWLGAVVSSPGGALLAAGDNGRQRVAVLAFDPARSNLTQLPAFPILARNLERWAGGWASVGDRGALRINSLPGATGATVTDATGAARSVALDGRPAGVAGLAAGTYTVAATGPGVVHRRAVTASIPVAARAGLADGPIDLTAWSRTVAPRGSSSLSSYLIALALIAMLAEWAYWRRLRFRT